MATLENKNEFDNKRKRTNNNYYTGELKENLEIDYKSIFDSAISRLRSVFPQIPKNLEHIEVHIRYQYENGIHHDIRIYDNLITVIDNIFGGGGSSYINKKNNSGGTRYYGGDGKWENFDAHDFDESVDNIIKNSNKCKVFVDWFGL